ncbi:hypothetical protein ACSSS7_004526 [Eimeria intestinalis]
MELDLAAGELMQCEFAEAFVDASVHTPRGPKTAAAGAAAAAGGAAAGDGQQQGGPTLAKGGAFQNMQPQKPFIGGVAAALRACRQRRSERYSTVLV